MSIATILITDTDRRRLGSSLERAADEGGRHDREFVALETDLDFAFSVLAEEVPGDVVTMNSTVEICDLDGGETESFTLAYPEDADSSRGWISVLDPLGRALLGRRIGEVVQVAVSAGPRRVRVERLCYQPERAGHFDR
ncbi:MAG: hypothetical protein EA424_22305 [Planctomycetaceae bacterium]|nr:MAG: hypothetical protein EA424_22305 [Planctomycetaceae bacterium]